MRWLKRLLLALLGLLVLLFALLWSVTDPDPWVPSKPGLLFSDLKRAQSLAQEYRPSRLVAGQRYVVTLSQREVNLLATSAMSTQQYTHLLNLDLQVSSDQVEARVSLPILRDLLGRWLNLSVLFSVAPGQLPEQVKVQIGSWVLPHWLNQQLETRWKRGLEPHWIGLWDSAQVKLDRLDNSILIGFTWIPETSDLITEAYLPDDVANQDIAKRVIQALTDVVAGGPTVMHLNQFLAAVLVKVMPTTAELPVLMVGLAQYISGNAIGPLFDVSLPTPKVISLTLSGRRDLARHYVISATLASQAGDTLAGQLGYFKELSDADNRSTGFSASDLLANQGGILFFHRLQDAVKDKQLLAFIADLNQPLLPSKSALTVLEQDWDGDDIADLMSVFIALPFYQVPTINARRR